MKLVLIFLSILIAFILGAVYGNYAGSDSRGYYDAPARIKVLSSVLDQNKANEWIEGEIIKQIRILNEPTTITPYKSGLFLKIVGHSDFVGEYNKYLPIVTESNRYKKKMIFLCKHREDYKDKCK